MGCRIAFGLLDTSNEVEDPTLAARARSLTVSWLRWGYFGDVLEGAGVDEILCAALEARYDYCLVQSYGHIIAENCGPNGVGTSDFFATLERWLAATDFFVAGSVVTAADGAHGLLSRCLLVDLRRYREFGRPAFGANLSCCPEGAVQVARLEPGCASRDRHLPGAALVSASLERGMPVGGVGANAAGFLVDFGSDLSRRSELLTDLSRQAAAASSGVFVLNFESYRDIEEPPDGFEPPLSALYSVAAGLKPNRLLQTHGFDAQTRVVYFDYSEPALEFRRFLLSDWDGRDYPSFLRRLFRRLPPTTHYYLWPGASPDSLDWSEMDRLWHVEADRWGGEDVVADHWARYRSLAHRFVLCNLLTSWQDLLRHIKDSPRSAIWWSNAFCTTYSAWHCTLEEKQDTYEKWIRALAAKAPHVFVYGSDHSNSSVNCISAGDYCLGYLRGGGGPLRARNFHRHRIRF
jgi:hypothetical protein